MSREIDSNEKRVLREVMDRIVQSPKSLGEMEQDVRDMLRDAAQPAAMTDVYLIWSNEHCAWWGPSRCGYVQRIADAGRYSHDEALEICTDAMPGRRGKEPLQEIPVRLQDVAFMLQRFAGAYPGHDPEPPAY